MFSRLGEKWFDDYWMNYGKITVTDSKGKAKKITNLSDFVTYRGGISEGDFVYCDPPYVGRHVDYFDSWNEESERQLFTILSQCPCRFILSTWHSNRHRENAFLRTLWSRFNILTKEHFYHVGAKEANRKPILEALVMNFAPKHLHEEPIERPEQLMLLEKVAEYQTLTDLPSRDG